MTNFEKIKRMSKLQIVRLITRGTCKCCAYWGGCKGGCTARHEGDCSDGVAIWLEKDAVCRNKRKN